MVYSRRSQLSRPVWRPRPGPDPADVFSRVHKETIKEHHDLLHSKCTMLDPSDLIKAGVPACRWGP